MYPRLTVLFTALTLASAASANCETPKQEAGMGDVTGQILVRFADGLSEADVSRIITRIGAVEIDRLMGGDIRLIEIAYVAAQDQVINALSGTDGVVYAEPNQEVSIPELPEAGDDSGDSGDSQLIPLPKVE